MSNVVQSEKVLSHLSTRVVQRFMGEEDFNKFYEEYQAAKLSGGSRYYQPSEEDIEAFYAYSKGEISREEAAKLFGVKDSSLVSRAGLVGIYLVREGMMQAPKRRKRHAPRSKKR